VHLPHSVGGLVRLLPAPVDDRVEGAESVHKPAPERALKIRMLGDTGRDERVCNLEEN
jgi:hypothetical protein